MVMLATAQIHFVQIRVGRNICEKCSITVQRIPFMRIGFCWQFRRRSVAWLNTFLQRRHIILAKFAGTRNSESIWNRNFGGEMSIYLWNDVTACSPYLIQVPILPLSGLFACFAWTWIRSGSAVCMSTWTWPSSMIHAPCRYEALHQNAENDRDRPYTNEQSAPAWWRLWIRFHVKYLWECGNDSVEWDLLVARLGCVHTQSNVPEPCMKKSTAAIIMVEPTMLDDTIVMNLTHNSVITANMMAPPPTATAISRTPNRWLGSVATQNVMIDPLVIAPANAHTRTAAIGCVDPSTAPKRPVTMASAATRDVVSIQVPRTLFVWEQCTYRNQLDCQSMRSLDFATRKCSPHRQPSRSESRRLADIGSQVWHKRSQRQQPLSRAGLKLFRAELMRMTDFPLHSVIGKISRFG